MESFKFSKHSDKKKDGYNIPIYKLEDIYSRLDRIFGDKAVIIGGRAVNIYCSKDARFTHDIDVVVKLNHRDAESVKAAKDRILENGFIYENDADGGIKKLIDESTGISIDLYYTKRVSGIEISDIISYSKKVSIGAHDTKVDVVNPALLVLMKIKSNREKDWGDIYNLMYNLYGTPENFVNKENKILSLYLNSTDKLLEVLNKIMYEKFLRR